MSRQFQFNWKVTTFALCFFVLFIYLGNWQLDREAEKRNLLSERARQLLLTPVAAPLIPTAGDLGGVRVFLSGQFLEQILLLDNRVLDGRVGFEVHQLFRDSVAGLFLVNRGFAPMGRTRQDLPQLAEVHNKAVAVTGRIYQPDDYLDILHNESEDLTEYPAIVQQIDTSQLQLALQNPIYPYVIRLDEDQFAALPRYWPSTVMQPERHHGYAIQWFTMALAVLLAWCFFSYREESL